MKLFSFIVLSFLFLNITHAQKLQFDFDYAQFGFDSSSNYLEFYYSFNQATLTIIDTDTSDFVQGVLSVSIMDSVSNETIITKDWTITNMINSNDSSDINRSLRGVIGFIINEGAYKCEIIGKDAVKSESQIIINEYLRIKPFIALPTSLSDIQLASNIIPSSENTSSIFYKNTYEVTPIPTAIFGESQPVLFYYLELYNLKNENQDRDLRLDQIIINSRGQTVSTSSKHIKRSVDSRVEVGKVMIYKFPTDTYTLMLNLIDSVANYGVSSTKRFFIYNPSVVNTDTFELATTPVLSTEFGAMSEEELDDLFTKSKYIAANSEKDAYESISTIEGKREFLYNFWKARDDNPSDEINDYYRLYLRRLEECNLKYSSKGREGWKTDRGRVYLLYGEPSEIDRYPNEIETKPYEIWHYYDLEGGVEFIFADLTGFSDYQLVHSTKRGELRDEYWTRRIIVQ